MIKHKDDYLDKFDSQEKAIDHCMWLNFKYRIAEIRFGILQDPKEKWVVCEEATAEELDMEFLDILPEDYSKMSYDHIRHIKMDDAPLPHFENLLGLFSTADGELLRYILASNLPIEKLIRHELASRGYDKNHRFCGFEKAKAIWLENED